MNVFYRFTTLILLLAFCIVPDRTIANEVVVASPMEMTKDFADKVTADQNIALTATVNTSYVSGWETLAAIKDGKVPKNSADHTNGAYGNWNDVANYNTYNWVEYTWTSAQQFSSTNVYWWDDGDGIAQPTDAYMSYWNGAEWVKAGNVGVALNQFNTLNLNFVSKKIRIYMISPKATGIIEWQVMGVQAPTCNATQLKPYVQIDANAQAQTNLANALIGQTVHLSVDPKDGGKWLWTGPNKFTASTRDITLTNVQANQAGTYIVTFLNACGESTVQNFPVTILTNSKGDSYTWSSYTPTLNYNFKQEFPSLAEPTKDLDDCPQVVGTQSSGWWTFKWGPNANSLVTSAAITPMLERMNKDFAYFRDVMGWPPDKRARRGYRSSIYLYGSGLCTDNVSNTTLGGWQSSINYKGEDWPMVLISYYPVYCYDPACKYSDIAYQTSNVVHEGIHSLLADLPGAKKAGWFQEGGNTWLQQEADAERSGDYSTMGYLNGSTLIAPFMPIECYRGWLQDDSFGGPSNEGSTVLNGTTELCTWRNFLGGTQYSNIFPVFLGSTLGKGSVPWVWRYCKSRVLEGLADTLGDFQTRRLISEFRAKQALVDMDKWTGACKKLLVNDFKMSIKAETQPSWLNPEVWIATPYAKTTNDGNGLLTPEYRTTPGWSGANQIPLHVTGNSVTVNFQPIGANMTCQLCYRTKSSERVYSQIVNGGDCTLKLDKAPANGVVFAVISNTDYIYNGEETRKAHFDYRLKLGAGIVGTADIYQKWFNWTDDIVDPTTSIPTIEKKVDDKILIYPNPVESKNGELNISIENATSDANILRIVNLLGEVVYENTITSELKLNISGLLRPGTYIVTLQSSQKKNMNAYKLLVK